MEDKEREEGGGRESANAQPATRQRARVPHPTLGLARCAWAEVLGPPVLVCWHAVLEW